MEVVFGIVIGIALASLWWLRIWPRLLSGLSPRWVMHQEKGDDHHVNQ